jgi:hypothetical protein
VQVRILLFVAFASAVAPTIGRPVKAAAGNIVSAQAADEVVRGNASVRQLTSSILDLKYQRLELLDRSTKGLQQSLRTNGCRKVDIDKFMTLTVQFANYGIEALNDAKKALETGGQTAEADFHSERLLAERTTIELHRSELNFADTALERGCTDAANSLYRHVFAYGPPEFSRRAQLGMRDVAARRAKHE